MERRWNFTHKRLVVVAEISKKHDEWCEIASWQTGKCYPGSVLPLIQVSDHSRQRRIKLEIGREEIQEAILYGQVKVDHHGLGRLIFTHRWVSVVAEQKASLLRLSQDEICEILKKQDAMESELPEWHVITRFMRS